ncbi:MAG TPA: hypothetical protein VK956_08450 [Verrucomicrobium sp.]|nr:hypothetical protein [Verrucomicrobium sp.]
MEIVSLRCNHCGAPLEVGASTRFVTCQFCHSQLAVKHSGSATYTEVIEQIAERTEQMAGNLRVIELQNELERLDREWADRRESFYVSGKHGSRHRPTRAGALTMAFIAVPFILVWISFAVTKGAPAFFPAFGVLAAGLIIYQIVNTLSKAGGLESAESQHQKDRRILIEQLEAAKRQSAQRS